MSLERHNITNLVLIDPDDFIFPRAATRVGPRFQANLPSIQDPRASSEPGVIIMLLLFLSVHLTSNVRAL